MRSFVRRMAWPCYFVLMAAFTGVAVQSYVRATMILRDHTVVDAAIELVDTDSRTKKGHTTTTYRFEYRYTVAGEEFSADYSAVNQKGEQYLDAETLLIAYDNGDPGKSAALHVLERQASISATIRRVLTGGAILAVLTFLVYVWAGYQRRSQIGV